jgi:hypothetical protein
MFRILVEKQSQLGRPGRMGEDNIHTDLKASILGQFELGLAEDKVEHYAVMMIVFHNKGIVNGVEFNVWSVSYHTACITSFSQIR